MAIRTRQTARTLGLCFVCLAAGAPATALAKSVPRVDWGTYYGGMESTAIERVAALPDGGVIVAGVTLSPTALASPGAHKTTCQDEDTFLARFDASGKRLWGTYYGGPYEDFGAALAVDAKRGVIFLAATSEDAEVLTTPGTHQPKNAGGDDSFLAAFGLDGRRLWGTYFGGERTESTHAVATDAAGHVYLCGATISATGVATPGSHQSATEGGFQSFLAKFDDSGVLQWATYYAGHSCDAIAIDDGRDAVYIAGAVDDEKPGGAATPGAHQPAPGGGSDAILARFTGAGERVWGTYYGGPDRDFGAALAVDGKGGLYLLGSTFSSLGIATEGAHQDAYGGGYGDAFLVKFDPDGARTWGTYYGGPDDDGGDSLATTGGSHGRPVSVYLAMTARSPGLATKKAPRPALAGGDDAVLVKFASNGARKWATYYGGSDFDGSPGVHATDKGVIYLGGNTSSSDAIATPGSHQSALADPDASIAFLARFIGG